MAHGWGHVLPPMTKVLAMGPRVGKRLLAVVRRGVRLLRRHHFRWWVDGGVGHRAQARRCGRPFQVVVSCAGGIVQGILVAQEIMDGVGVALHHAHKLGRGLAPMDGLVQLPSVDACGVA